MINSDNHNDLKQEIKESLEQDREILDKLRKEISVLRSQVRRIQERSTTAISLVGTDGGNNYLQFDPFLVELIRVVDSSNNQYVLEVITPTTNVKLAFTQPCDISCWSYY
ncbi:MAG: hypothetical protein AAFQ07_17870, partial [Chloroflexota bacterium]